jgi:hypothetical protein
MRTIPIGVALLLGTPGSVLADCPEGAAREVSESHMAALLSTDCEARLTDLSAPPGWIRECRRGLQPPHSDHKAEFARRTEFHFSRLVQSGTTWVAVGRLRGPDPVEFDSILAGQAFCGASWTSYRPDGQDCSLDWSAIPVREYEGGVPLVCKGKHWVVSDLE